MDACNKFDLKLAGGGGRDSSTGGVSFSQYSSLLTQRSQLNNWYSAQNSQATMLEQLTTFMALGLPDPETNPTLSAFRHEASVACQLADRMVRYNIVMNSTYHILCPSPLSSLPLTIRSNANSTPRTALIFDRWKSLGELNVVRQRYHGGSFIGNHMHKLLQVHKNK